MEKQIKTERVVVIFFYQTCGVDHGFTFFGMGLIAMKTLGILVDGQHIQTLQHNLY